MAGLKLFMEKKILKIEEEPTFPEESDLIIEEILKKYGFWEMQEKEFKKFSESEIPAERKKICENLPGYKISKLVRKYGEGEISLENLPVFLEKGLNISGQEAKRICEELEKKLLVFVKPVKETKLPAKTKPSISPPEKPKLPQKPDVYQEPIE